MSKFILQVGTENTSLHTVCIPIKSIDKTTKKLIKVMKAYVFTTINKNALGLAAPQLNVLSRVILTYLGKKWVIMINPEIENFSEETYKDEEGCLSVPGKYGDVWRPSSITVSFLDEKGLKKKLFLSQLDARVVQHEVDHLDGILFVDRMEEKDIKKMNIAAMKNTKKEK